ncbi:hypothetical protein XENORESO_014849, partial [Xenotaenia resolanae]
MSRHLDDSFRLGNGRWALPLPPAVFQKKVLNLLMELRDQHKRTQPISSAVHVERMAAIEDLEREEECLCNPKAFEALSNRCCKLPELEERTLRTVSTKFLIGSSPMHQCTFNMKGKEKQGKRSLEKTKVYGAIK